MSERRDHLFSVFRHPAFRWIWMGALVSNVGNWMEAVAQGWLVQQRTASPMFVELLAASEFVPAALFMLAAGWLADRYDRQRLLMWGQVLMMAFAAVLALLAHLGLASPWAVIALAFAEGAAWAFVTPAWQSIVPALVPRDELPSAIAMNSAQFNTARLVGPMLAGGLLTAAGAAFVFDLNVLSFIGIVIVLALVRVPGAMRAPTAAGELKRTGIGHALRWALHERGPRRLLLGLFVFAIFAAPVQGLLPSYADSVQHVGAHGYGVLLSCLGAGAIFGALTLSRLPARYPRHRLIPLSMLGFSCCAMIYGSATHWLFAAAALAVGGVFWVWSLASSSTAMQLLVPESLRGRAMSVLSLATTGPLPLGHLLGGVVAHAFGVRTGIVAGAIALAAFSTWSAWAREPAIDQLELAPPPPQGLRATVREALAGPAHLAHAVEPGVPPGSAEPLED